MTNTHFDSCIEACNQCAAACMHCASACLKESDVNMLARCIALDLDCAEICRTAAGLMARDSDFAVSICMVCAEACDVCAEECERHAAMDHCRLCAEACRRCATECRDMGAAAGHVQRSGESPQPTAH
ncbi:MAG TPA: four-helix bundle copper-binding protein [Paucimonas sp.]|nr:four-helix bundle copper-binding protein [Paucimonas sp.]